MEEALSLGLRHRAIEAMDPRNFARAAVVTAEHHAVTEPHSRDGHRSRLDVADRQTFVDDELRPHC
jgi:hypothetical protein